MAYAALNELLFQPKEYQASLHHCCCVLAVVMLFQQGWGPAFSRLCPPIPALPSSCTAAAAAAAAAHHLPPYPPVLQCFNHTLTKIKDDPRVTVRLGEWALPGPSGPLPLSLYRTRASASWRVCEQGPLMWPEALAPCPATPPLCSHCCLLPTPSCPLPCHPSPAGTPISAYGQESHNRAARQRIPHRCLCVQGLGF